MSYLSGLSWSRREFLVRLSALGAATGMGGALLTACRGGAREGAGGGRPGRDGETLFVAGFQFSPPTTFNPFAPSPAWPVEGGALQLVYESLLRYNLLTGVLDPGLAKKLEMPDPLTMVLPLQEAAAWQDGKPLTADDVVFTFALAKRHPEVFYASFWKNVADVRKEDDHSVSLTLAKEPYNPGVVKEALTNTWILPQHVWEPIEAGGKALAEQDISDPLGSGPYRVERADQQQISLVRYDEYWGKGVYGGLPAPRYIVHPVFKSNDEGNLAFSQGRVDVSGQFTPRIWEMWEKEGKPVGTWFKDQPYHIPGSLPMLVVNTTRPGLNHPAVRRALAFAIDYADIADKAMSRYSEPARSSLLLPTGGEASFFNQANVDANGWKYDPAESARILETELGARKANDGIYVLADGTRLGPWKAQTPTGWSDWQAALRILEANAKKAGFDIAAEFPQETVVTDAVQNGRFDFVLWWVAGSGPASPWQRFREVLDDRGVPGVGSRAFWNYGRFHHPAVPDLLDQVAGASDQAQARHLYTQLDTIFMQGPPMIPLMYRPQQFYEYNQSNWTNFPNEENSYAPPTFSGSGNEWLFRIKKVS